MFGGDGRRLVDQADTDRHTFGVIMKYGSYDNNSGPGWILDDEFRSES